MILLNRIKRIFSNESEWYKPRNVRVIIYGEFNSDLIKKYVSNVSYSVLSSRKINVYIALKNLFSSKMSIFNYYVLYLKAAKPELVITAVDNDLLFFALKEAVPEIKTILLQYAWHGELADVFGVLKRNPPIKKYQIDHMFFFNDNIKNKYLEYIEGQAIVSGNFKNNISDISYTHSRDRVVSFISQYRREQVFHPVFFYEGKKAYYRDDFYQSEAALLPLLSKYCQEKSLRLQIVGHGSTPEEYHFFGNLIGNFDWDFIPRFEDFDSYKTIKRSNIVVGVDSTLAYEAFGQGKRTCFFSFRSKSLDDVSYTFGWPGSFNHKGPMWTDTITEEEVKRVMDFLLTAPQNEWEVIHQNYQNEIMAYDVNNSQLTSLLSIYGVS
jgi:surface carbohydrate biosynthesis protein